MRKKIIECLVICILLLPFQGFSAVLANELDRITIPEQEGEGLPQEKQTETPSNTTSDGQEASPSIIAKEPEVYYEKQTYTPESEVLEKRDAYSKTYDLGNGRYHVTKYFSPIHKYENGMWEDIDNTVEPSKARSGIPTLENKDGAFDFTYRDNQVLVSNDKNEKVHVIFPDASMEHLKTKENAVYVTSMYDDVDMQMTLTSNELHQDYILSNNTTTTLTYDLKTDLNVTLHEDRSITITNEDGEVSFLLIPPIIQDANQQEMAHVTQSMTQEDDVFHITIKLDQEWLQREDIVYPIKVRAATTASMKAVSNTEGVYIRSNWPFTTSNYEHLFVGNDINNYAQVSPNIGTARTFINLGIPSSGKNQVIDVADLKLYKKHIFDNECNDIDILTTNSLMTLSNINWNSQPSGTKISNSSFSSAEGYKTFDVKNYVQDFADGGAEKTIILQASDESGASAANVFYSAVGTPQSQRPTIDIEYHEDYDVNPNLNINQFDREFRVFTRNPDGFQAISFDGLAKPDSTVHFKLQEKQADGSFVYKKDYTATSSKYFVKPIFITNPIRGVQSYLPTTDINYTTDYIYAKDLPQLDKFYNFEMSVTNGSSSSNINNTDGFSVYQVKNGDTLRSIAAYYGIKVDTIIADNQLQAKTVKEGDKLFLRFLTNNPKLSPDAYRPPVTSIQYSAKYIPAGPNCTTCYVLDPINTASGNYHHESMDFTLKDYDDLSLKRTYNSTLDKTSTLFGIGWSSNYEQYLSKMSDDSILYHRGDGRVTKIVNLKASPSERLEIKQVGDTIEIYDKASDETYIFDAYYTLTQIRTRQGFLTTIHYDDYGMITSMDLGAKHVTFSYNVFHLINQITLPDGTYTQYEYDANRRLTRYRDQGGYSEEYHYDTNNQITSIKDKRGEIIAQNTYDNDGRILTQKDAANQSSSLSYSGNRVEVKYFDGTKEAYEQSNYAITKVTDANGHSRSFTYDANANITSETNEANEETRYVYDANNNLSKKTNPDGTYEQYQYDANSNVTSKRSSDGTSESFTYDAKNNMLTHNKDNEAQMTYQYDAQSRITRMEQNGIVTTMEYQGANLVKERRSDGLIKTYAYDARGNIVKEQDNTGKVKTFAYNNQNLVIQQSDNQGSEQFAYDGNGNVTSYIDKLGALTTTTYDALNRPTKITKGSLTKVMSYDAKGNLLSEQNEQGIVTSYTYDSVGNKLSETIHGQTTKFTYDSRSRLIKSEYPNGSYETKRYVYDNLVEERNKQGLITTHEYDSLNRLTKTTYPNKTYETKTYNGTILSEAKDTNGVTTSYAYDGRGNLLTKTQNINGETLVTTNTYDQRDRMVTSSLAGVTTTYSYDLHDNQISVSVNGRRTTNQYDVNDQLIQVIDPMNHKTSYSYDAMGNQTSITTPNGATSTKTYNAMNQVSREQDVLGNTTSYTYNALGQLITTEDANNILTTYSYDRYGNVATTTLDGVVIRKDTYDALNRKIEEVTLSEAKRYTYDAFDQVIQEENKTKGITTTNTYNAYGNLLTSKDNATQSETYEYDSLQRLIKMTDSYGRVSTKQYDKQNRVTKETTVEGISTEYTYDVFGNILTQTSCGVTTTNTYDVYQNKHSENNGLYTKTFAYDTLNRLIKTTDEASKLATSKTYDGMGNIASETDALGNTIIYGYDAKNRKVSETNVNGTITTTYDAYDHVTQVEQSDGTTTKTRYNTLGQKIQEEDERGFVTTYGYDAKGLLIQVIDALGNTTSIAYDTHQNPTQITLANGAILTQRYDAYDRVVEEVDPNGNVTKTEYDALGNVIQTITPTKTTTTTYDALGRSVQVEENGRILQTVTYDTNNRIIETKDAMGQTITNTYDTFGRKTETNDKGHKTTYVYDVYNNLIEETQNQARSYTYTYDALGRQVGKALNGREQETQVYDALGNVIELTNKGISKLQLYDKRNRLIEVQEKKEDDTFQPTKKTTYDESGNIIVEEDGVGNQISYTYDGANNLTSQTDGNGNTTKFAYNSVNALVKVETPQGRLLHYSYDKAGNKTKEYFNSLETSYTYDEENRLIKESDITGSETTTYDTFGNVATVTKKDGTTITQEYDALHRMTKQNERTFAYDEQNNQIEATNDNGTLRTEYDAYGNITSTTDPNKNIVRYTYDTFGNKEHIIYPNDEIVTYTYNDQDQVLSVRSDNHVLAQYEYDKRGNVKTLTQDNVVTSYTYDNANRTIHYLTQKDGNVTTQNQSYAFDANGNVIEEKQNGVTNTYQYNEVDELKQSTKTIHDKQITTTYSHDLYGNRLEKKDDGSYQISNYNDKNQLTSIDSDKGTTYLHYDAIGNIDSIKYEDGFSERYTYDAFNQLIEIKNNEDKIVHYTYDATGERIETLLEDKETYQTKSYYTEEGKLDFPYYHDRVNSDDINEAFEVAKRQAEIKQANGNQCTITSNHYNLSEYTNEDEYSEVVLDRTTPYSQVLMQDGDTIYYGINRLEREGTKYIAGLNNTITQTITDNKVTTYEYDDYGYSDDIKSGFSYNGEYQEATGLINLRARYYNPRLGRFIQIDSYKGEDSQLASKNRYTYVYNNPYKYIDESGNRPLSMNDEDNRNGPVGTTARDIALWIANLAQEAFEKQRRAQEQFQQRQNFMSKVVNGIPSPPSNRIQNKVIYPSPKPCPPSFITGVGKGINEVVTGIGNGLQSTVQGALSNMADPIHGNDKAASEIAKTLSSAKFKVQLIISVAVSLAAVVTLPISGPALGGIAGATALVTYSGTGETFDYFITYDSVAKNFLKARGCSTLEEYLGYQTVKELLNVGTGYTIGKAVYSMKYPELVGDGRVESWYKKDGSINYPPNNGAVVGSEKPITLQCGSSVGRYGGIGKNSDFVTQTGVPADKLSLPPTTDPNIYQIFKVLKPIEGVTQSIVAPWAGSQGGGLQYLLPKPINWYIKNGYLK